MANAIIGGQAAVPASATNVTTLLSLSAAVRTKKLTIKNAGGAANPCYLGDSDVTTAANAHVELSADQAYEYWSGESHRISTDDVYVVGTSNAANIVYINGIS